MFYLSLGFMCLMSYFVILIWGNFGGLNWTNISYEDHHLFLTMPRGVHQHGTLSDLQEVEGQAQILHLAPGPSKSNDSGHATCIMLYVHLLPPGPPQLQIPAVHQQDEVDMFRVIALPSTEVWHESVWVQKYTFHRCMLIHHEWKVTEIHSSWPANNDSLSISICFQSTRSSFLVLFLSVITRTARFLGQLPHSDQRVYTSLILPTSALFSNSWNYHGL